VLAHVVALAAYTPWFVLIATQPKSSALEWIMPLWRTTPPMLAIPRSLEAFGIGGSFRRMCGCPLRRLGAVCGDGVVGADGRSCSE